MCTEAATLLVALQKIIVFNRIPSLGRRRFVQGRRAVSFLIGKTASDVSIVKAVIHR
jgi:hypothetical protein